LAVFPAAWLQSVLPSELRCGTLAGSLWRGHCSGLTFTARGTAPLRLDSLHWTLRPLALLRGRVQADVSLAGTDVSADGSITLQSGGRVRIEGLSATGGLDHARLAAFPAGWNARAETRELTLQIAGGRIAALGGVLLVSQLRDARGTGFGDFKLQFAQQQAPPFRGALTDQGGPMQLSAELLLNADQSWQLQGTVVLRPGSPPGLASALDQLATADLDGRRSFRLEGAAREPGLR
ncbi:MAG TPA: type II secretion system protein N, partial [Steroidobacteraceae bacterium]|nr:type II secretion system protein N [Steroidobacteraceae bacterium]